MKRGSIHIAIAYYIHLKKVNFSKLFLKYPSAVIRKRQICFRKAKWIQHFKQEKSWTQRFSPIVKLIYFKRDKPNLNN